MLRAPLVICLGEALVDRLGPPGADPAAAGAACEDRLGGAPANVACGLARLGTPSAFAGRLGSDAIGTAFASLFATRGVDTSALQQDEQRPSRIVLVRRDRQGERVFGGFAGDTGQGFADQALDADALSAALQPLLPRARWLLLGTIPLASPASAQAALQAVRLAGAAGAAVAVDVNWRPTFWDAAADSAAGPSPEQSRQIVQLLSQAHLIKCAAEEAIWLFNTAEPTAISAALPGRPLVVVSDGPALLRWGGGPSAAASLQPCAVSAVDSTGAGDAFSAGLLHGLCCGDAPLDQVMRFASACGALVCQGAGAIDPQPTAAEVNAWLRSRS